jgi:hypothetical protein
MTDEQMLKGFAEMMKGFWNNQDLKVPNLETPCKQEPCGDIINRRAAIDAMNTWDKFGCDPDGRLVRFDDNKHYVPYVRYDDMVYVIKSLPSAQP